MAEFQAGENGKENDVRIGPFLWTGIYGILIAMLSPNTSFGHGLIFWSVLIMAFEFFFNRK
jgi:hypothetical protein